MKRIILFSTALVFFVASQASAAVVVNDDVKMTTGINSGAQSGSGGGGPFLAQIYADAPNTTVDTTPAAGPIAEFYTFCVQHSENLATWNNLDGLTAGSTVGTPRLLTGYAAWAYNKFTVDSINTPGVGAGQIGSSAVADVDKLIGYQKAIWAGMINGPLASATSQIGTASSDNNVGGTGGLSGGVYAAAGVQWSDFIAGTWQGYNSVSDPTGSIRAGLIGNALIMNLSNGSGTPTQDMVIVNAGSLGVPEPASLAVWSILAGGAAGLSVARRRRAATRGRWTDDNREAILSVIEGKHGH